MLNLNSTSLAPNSIPQAGGNVRFSFNCSSTAPSRFSTRYFLVANEPYRFPGGSLSVSIAPRPVSPTGNSYQDPLTLVLTGNPANAFKVQINIELQELDPSGNPIGNPQRGARSVLIDAAVAKFRVDNNMSQVELAKKVGVARSTISRLEQGGNPSDETVEKLLSEMSKK